MRIVSISDIHGHLGSMDLLEPWLASADIVVLAGDITNFGHAADARAIVEPLHSRAARVLAVTGNCDYPDVSVALNEHEINLESGPVVVDGFAWVGLGGSLPGPGLTPNVFGESELAARLELAAGALPEAGPFFLVSHQPPKDTAADRTLAGQHVGSQSVRDFIRSHQPLICFTAHIHESRGVGRIGDTLVVNPGPLGGGSLALAEFDGQRVVTCEIRSLR